MLTLLPTPARRPVRPQTLAGAWAGAGHALWVLRSATVWFAAVASAGIAVASCIINDYFDYLTGVDGMNASHKPLPAGTVPPDGPLLLASTTYISLLAATCFVRSAGVRLCIAASSLATLLYTPGAAAAGGGGVLGRGALGPLA